MDTVFVKDLTARIRTVLAELGITERELSRRAGLSSSAVWQILNERVRSPKTESLVEIARVAGVEVEWLATGKGPRRRKTPGPMPAAIVEAAQAERYSDAETEIAASLVRDLPGEVTADVARELLAKARLQRRDAVRLLASSTVVREDE
jgi:transcriptional regulator with XRE-family HTH domain